MFDRLKRTLSDAVKNISEKELSEKDVDKLFSDLQVALLESDVAPEVIDHLADTMKKDLIGQKLEKGQNAPTVVRNRLKEYVTQMFERAGTIDLASKVNAKKNGNEPYVIVFLGINGTGKTTTIAKVASMLKGQGFSVVVAAGDTHRAGAIEQVSEHASRLGIRVIAQRYGADPAAVGRDAVLYGKSHRIDVVLIDTAGRMQTSKNLMDEMGKIIRVVNPDLKIFIGDSLAGNDTINQAREFHQYTKFDGAILTKTDADVKGGAAISIVHITGKPILYLGMGQQYNDLIPFDVQSFVGSILGDGVA
jgi:fused signal recognition particle receptor